MENSSPKTATLMHALSLARADIQAIRKEARNDFISDRSAKDVRYATIDNVLEEALPALRAKGISVVQRPEVTDGTTVRLETILTHWESGEWISGTLVMRPTKPHAQELGSCMTYARRYSLVAMLCLEQEDDDGNRASAGEHRKKGQREISRREESNALMGELLQAIQEATKPETLTEVSEGISAGLDAQLMPDHLDMVRAEWASKMSEFQEAP